MVQTLRERWLDWLVAAVLLGLFGVAVGGWRGFGLALLTRFAIHLTPGKSGPYT